MDLTKNTSENINFMVSEIVNKLKMVNIGAMKIDQLGEEAYEELCEIHELVKKKDTFSPNEMQAIAEELGRLRNE